MPVQRSQVHHQPQESSAPLRRRRRRAWTVALAVSALWLAGCGSDDTSGTDGSTGSSTADTTLRVSAVASGPFTRQFNPLLISSQSAGGYAVLPMYQQLMIENFHEGVLEPDLATDYAWSDDGLSLTITIRTDFKWSDGTAVTPKDVAFTFDLLRENDALNGQGLPLAGASAEGDDTVVVTFTEPAFQTVWWFTSIVPESQWSKVADPVAFANTEPMGSGPYQLKTFTPQVITLERNPHYPTPGGVDTVLYLSYDSDSSAVAALQGGQVDWISPSISDPASVAGRDPDKIGYSVALRSTGVIFLLPNLAEGPTKDLVVRQAINAALDRQEISSTGLNDLNAPITSPVGLNADSAGEKKLIAAKYQDVSYGPPDPQQAKDILTGAGYTMNGDGIFVSPDGQPLSLELLVPTSSGGFGDMVGAGNVLARQMKAAGIEIKVKTVAATTWRDATNLGQFQLTMRSVGGTLSFFSRYDKLLSQDLLVPLGEKARANYQRYDNPDVTALLERYQGAAPGSEDEATALEGLQDLVVNDLPAIPLYLNSGIGMWRTDTFTGWPDDEHPYAVTIGTQPSVSTVLNSLKPID